jgi:hypothetical protein
MLSPPNKHTIGEITTLVSRERDRAYEEGVYTGAKPFERLMVWLLMEPFDLDAIQRWAKAEHTKLLSGNPFLLPLEDPTNTTRRTAVFEVEYNYFEPGTWVTPTSPRSVLEENVMYKITKCLPPRFADDRASCFVEGRETGVSTEYLRAVEPHPGFNVEDREGGGSE